MSLREVLDSAIENRQAKVAHPLVGIVTSYDEDTHMVTIKCTARSGNKYIYYELPWMTEPSGIYNSEPEQGLHVIVGFRMGDEQFPIIMGRYDPFYSSTIREQAKRKLETLALKTTGNMV